MDKIGKLVVCDRCGMTTFRPDAGGIYAEAIGWTLFALPETIGCIDLCPTCSRDLKRVVNQYMSDYKDVCKGMFIRHDSYINTEEGND